MPEPVVSVPWVAYLRHNPRKYCTVDAPDLPSARALAVRRLGGASHAVEVSVVCEGETLREAKTRVVGAAVAKHDKAQAEARPVVAGPGVTGGSRS